MARWNPIDDAVLSYLAEHPHAMDTLDGIAEWWIEREHIRVEVLAVARAVHRLVDRGLVQRVEGPDRVMYRLKSNGFDGGQNDDES